MSYRKYSLRATKTQVVENPTPKQQKKKQQDRNRYLSNKEYTYREIERRGGCQFCHAILSWVVYEWHHIDDDDETRAVISELVNRSTTKRIDYELSKCVCLCPTCHTTFHQDLMCMLDHRYRPDIASCTHVDGEFFDPDQFKPVQINPLEKLLTT
ncbi:hypothetical protein AAJ62_gp137 [Synechococcus phage ACG-2014g]|jgi:hypothetical protein|uniref:HNH nuclease domain-containing protein n=1 Tax=Synechococcus phage ACG-2014g TaxID=1493512 RepID=A0A0E3FC57_9CAUD|nr:hypothetical protein AAJ62_gp137 [Synechococcus phage ACG-2014g]AIX24481.1 hypothetical protein Syn7803US105_137 [Synechococcus phage ACG-2014g]